MLLLPTPTISFTITPVKNNTVLSSEYIIPVGDNKEDYVFINLYYNNQILPVEGSELYNDYRDYTSSFKTQFQYFIYAPYTSVPIGNEFGTWISNFSNSKVFKILIKKSNHIAISGGNIQHEKFPGQSEFKYTGSWEDLGNIYAPPKDPVILSFTTLDTSFVLNIAQDYVYPGGDSGNESTFFEIIRSRSDTSVGQTQVYTTTTFTDIATTPEYTFTDDNLPAGDARYFYTVRSYIQNSTTGKKSYSSDVRSGGLLYHDKKISNSISLFLSNEEVSGQLDAPEITDIIVNDRNIYISWDSVLHADKYDIYLEEEDSDSVLLLSTIINNFTYTISEDYTDLTARISVIARVNSNNGVWTDSDKTYSETFTILSNADVPRNIRCDTRTENSLTISWDKVTNANKYIIQKFDSSIFGEDEPKIPNMTADETDDGIASCSSYAIDRGSLYYSAYPWLDSPSSNDFGLGNNFGKAYLAFDGDSDTYWQSRIPSEDSYEPGGPYGLSGPVSFANTLSPNAMFLQYEFKKQAIYPTRVEIEVKNTWNYKDQDNIYMPIFGNGDYFAPTAPSHFTLQGSNDGNIWENFSIGVAMPITWQCPDNSSDNVIAETFKRSFSITRLSGQENKFYTHFRLIFIGSQGFIGHTDALPSMIRGRVFNINTPIIIKSFQIYGPKDNGSWNTQNIIEVGQSDTPHYEVKDLNPNSFPFVDYYDNPKKARICSVRGTSYSPWAIIPPFKTFTHAPYLTLVPDTAGRKIDIYITPGDDENLTFRIYKKKDGESDDNYKLFSETQKYHLFDSDIENKTGYYYKICAIDNNKNIISISSYEPYVYYEYLTNDVISIIYQDGQIMPSLKFYVPQNMVLKYQIRATAELGYGNKKTYIYTVYVNSNDYHISNNFYVAKMDTFFNGLLNDDSRYDIKFKAQIKVEQYDAGVLINQTRWSREVTGYSSPKPAVFAITNTPVINKTEGGGFKLLFRPPVFNTSLGLVGAGNHYQYRIMRIGGSGNNVIYNTNGKNLYLHSDSIRYAYFNIDIEENDDYTFYIYSHNTTSNRFSSSNIVTYTYDRIINDSIPCFLYNDQAIEDITLDVPDIIDSAFLNEDSIRFSWTAVLNATHYDVEVRKILVDDETDYNFEQLINNLATNSIDINNIESGLTYRIRVRAKNNNDYNYWIPSIYKKSDPVIYTMKSPKNFIGKLYPDDTVELSWDASEGADYYQIDGYRMVGLEPSLFMVGTNSIGLYDFSENHLVFNSNNITIIDAQPSLINNYYPLGFPFKLLESIYILNGIDSYISCDLGDINSDFTTTDKSITLSVGLVTGIYEVVDENLGTVYKNRYVYSEDGILVGKFDEATQMGFCIGVEDGYIYAQQSVGPSIKRKIKHTLYKLCDSQSISSIDFNTNTFTCNSHGLENLMRISFRGEIPYPMVSDVLYYVRNIAENTFQISLEEAGAITDLKFDDIDEWTESYNEGDLKFYHLTIPGFVTASFNGTTTASSGIKLYIAWSSYEYDIILDYLSSDIEFTNTNWGLGYTYSNYADPLQVGTGGSTYLEGGIQSVKLFNSLFSDYDFPYVYSGYSEGTSSPLIDGGTLTYTDDLSGYTYGDYIYVLTPSNMIGTPPSETYVSGFPAFLSLTYSATVYLDTPYLSSYKWSTDLGTDGSYLSYTYTTLSWVSVRDAREYLVQRCDSETLGNWSTIATVTDETEYTYQVYSEYLSEHATFHSNVDFFRVISKNTENGWTNSVPSNIQPVGAGPSGPQYFAYEKQNDGSVTLKWNYPEYYNYILQNGSCDMELRRWDNYGEDSIPTILFEGHTTTITDNKFVFNDTTGGLGRSYDYSIRSKQLSTPNDNEYLDDSNYVSLGGDHVLIDKYGQDHVLYHVPYGIVSLANFQPLPLFLKNSEITITNNIKLFLRCPIPIAINAKTPLFMYGPVGSVKGATLVMPGHHLITDSSAPLNIYGGISKIIYLNIESSGEKLNSYTTLYMDGTRTVDKLAYLFMKMLPTVEIEAPLYLDVSDYLEAISSMTLHTISAIEIDSFAPLSIPFVTVGRLNRYFTTYLRCEYSVNDNITLAMPNIYDIVYNNMSLIIHNEIIEINRYITLYVNSTYIVNSNLSLAMPATIGITNISSTLFTAGY